MNFNRLYSGMPTLNRHKVWAEIDTSALIENYRRLSEKAPNTRKICVVKADAYGHTSAICAAALLDAGCDFFAVSCLEEAVEIRNICTKVGKHADVLILGYTDPIHARHIAEYDVIQTVVGKSHAEGLARAASDESCTIRAHVALDTRMNRVGLCARNSDECKKAAEDIFEICKHESLSVEGMFTHFSRADEEADIALSQESFTRRQFACFNTVKDMLKERGISLFSHVCNSAATVRFPEFSLDGVRLGILLYGVPPSAFVEAETTPVMSLHTVISHIHRLSEGDSVSYGGSFVSDGDKTIATLPIGYADGFLRAYSGAQVTVHTSNGDFSARIIGRVCMDQCMIDVTDIPAGLGDTVTLFGSSPDSLSALSRAAGTIEYETLCLISGRVPRIAVSGRRER